MSRQRFATTDFLSLAVEGDPPAGQRPNLLLNPDGAYGVTAGYAAHPAGGYGWLTDVAGVTVDTGTTWSPLGPNLGVTTTATQAVHFTSEAHPAAPGEYAAARLDGAGDVFGIYARARVQFLDAAGAVLSSSPQTGYVATGALVVAPVAAPAGTASVWLRVDVYASSSGANMAGGSEWRFTNARLSTAATAAELTALGYYYPTWVDVLGAALELNLDRAELNLGTLEASIRDANLDPAVATTLRKGRRIRLFSQDTEPLWTGEILNAKVDYRLLEDDPDQRANITLSAVDPTTKPAGVPRPYGVAGVTDLATLLEGAGIGWNLNGETGQTAAVPITVSVNSAASLLDQVAITRDSNLAYAWVDRKGFLNVWDGAELPTAAGKTIAAVLDEDRYDDVVLDYDTDRCINSVGLNYLRLDPATGESQEVKYGPYVDPISVRAYGLHNEEFTVHGIAEDEATLTAYAGVILTANATPRRTVREVRLTFRDEADLNPFAFVDLYDAVRVVNTRGDVDEVLRVVSIRQQITHDRWVLTLGFAGDNTVAMPQLTPSPPPTSVLTLAQLLRPVGEVSIMLGLPSQVWPGWLVLNGAALTAGEYPELEDWLVAAGLSATVLPDFTDRLPVAAGIKALGAKSGAWAKNVPPHVHAMTEHTHGAGAITTTTQTNTTTGGTATRVTGLSGTTAGVSGGAPPNSGPAVGATFDVTPPVIGVYYVIRAKSGV